MEKLKILLIIGIISLSFMPLTTSQADMIPKYPTYNQASEEIL